MPHTCLDDKTAQLFALGRLSRAEAASVTEHLKNCTSCQDEVLRVQCETFVETHTGTMEGHTWLEGFAMIAMRDAETSGRNAADRCGQTIAGRYQLEESVGAGGMGHVYAASDRQLGDRLVAVKLLKSEIQSQAFRQRFEREIQNAAKLEHENIMRVYDGGIHEGEAYLVTELLDGETIKEILDKRESIRLSDAYIWVSQAAHGLSAAHNRGIVHRDVSPSNLFVTHDDKVKLIDFGISISEDLELGVTSTSQIVGALRYMSPEQRNPEEAVDHRTDIYSLGLVLHELIYGYLPRGSVAEIAEVSRSGEVVASEVRGLIETMLSEPERRPSLATVRSVLSETLSRDSNDLTSDRTPLPVAPAASLSKSRPWNSRKLLLAYAGIGLVILSGIVISIYRQDGSVDKINVGEGDRVVITDQPVPSAPDAPESGAVLQLAAPVVNPLQTPDTDGTFTISWRPVVGASFYQVAEFANTNTWKNLNIRRVEGTSTTITKTKNGHFIYRVIAWFKDGQGGWKPGHYSEAVVQTVALASADLPPAAPVVDPLQTPDTDGTFTISWRPVAGASFYQVAEFANTSTWKNLNTHRVEGTSTTITKPENGQFIYRVIAWFKDGQGGWKPGHYSEAVVQTVALASADMPLAAPVIDAPETPDADGIFAIRWQPVPGASFYQVAEFPDANTWQELNIHRVSGGTTTTIKKAENGDFLYRVIAWTQDSQGDWKHGPYSEPIVQKVNLAPTDLPLDAPVVDPPESSDTDGTFTIRWQPVPDASFYEVAEFPSSTSWEQVSLHRVDGKTSTTLTRPENGTYTWRVIAWGQDAQGNRIHSPFSEAVEVVVKRRTGPDSDAATAQSPETTDQANIRLCRSIAEWAIASGGYVVYRMYGPNGELLNAEARSVSELPKKDFWINRLVVRNVSIFDKLPLLQQLVGMTGLVLSSAKLVDDDIRRIVELRDLRWLYLDGTQITDACVSEINKLPELESLSIGAPAITDEGVFRLGDFERLTAIVLNTSQVTDEAIESLQRFPKLHSIGLAYTGITDAGVAKLIHFKAIDRLQLDGCRRLTDNAIQHLARLEGLKELSLTETNLTPAAIDSLRAKLPGCTIDD